MSEQKRQDQSPRLIPQAQQTKAAEREWDVCARHSPFLLKNVVVKAATPEEAKALFLEKVKERHREKAARQKGEDAPRNAARVMEVYELGLRDPNVEIVIRPATEARAEREALKKHRDDFWQVNAGLKPKAEAAAAAS